MGNENTVFVGKKDTKSYVLAVMTQLNQGSSTVHVKARGKSISKAVDVAELVRNRYVQDLKVKDIIISTDELTNDDNSKIRVSAVEIVLGK